MTGVDADVISRAQAGDPGAFEEIYAQYQRPITSFLYRLVQDRDLARDLAQDTFLKAYLAIGRTGPGLNTGAWLFTIAKNAAFSALRRRRLISWLPLGGYHQANLDLDPVGNCERREALQRALRSLPRDSAACLLLRAHHGFSYEEIGQIMGLSEGGAKSRVCRARLALAERLRVEESEGQGR